MPKAFIPYEVIPPPSPELGIDEINMVEVSKLAEDAARAQSTNKREEKEP
jgi:hypothetical protein